MAPGPDDNFDGQGPINLDKTYPQIADPLNAGANLFNAEMRRLAAKWWEAMGAPKDNKQTSDPDTNFSLNCETVGLPPPVDASSPENAEMLPGVISVACGRYIDGLGTAHGGGENWGFNWILREGRTVRAGDASMLSRNGSLHWRLLLMWIGVIQAKSCKDWIFQIQAIGSYHPSA